MRNGTKTVVGVCFSTRMWRNGYRLLELVCLLLEVILLEFLENDSVGIVNKRICYMGFGLLAVGFRSFVGKGFVVEFRGKRCLNMLYLNFFYLGILIRVFNILVYGFFIRSIVNIVILLLKKYA